ncbi:MAG: GNAT family N-acetyltransferase [Synergistaceae bacterium]|nr:GNAT family N-acetyltransferase [Synergistaceae bacterium]
MTKLREAVPEDAEALVNIYAPYVLETAITFEYDVPEVSEFRERITHTLKNYPYIAAESEGIICGYAYAGAFVGRKAYERSCEVSIYIARDFRGRGLGRSLYAELESRLKAQGILNLYACIAYPETEDEYLTRDSVKFHERMGFRLAGHFHDCGYKFGRWYSMVWMEKIIGVHE